MIQNYLRHKSSLMNTLKFTKMHGLGNDFIVIDGINQRFDPDSKQIQRWGHRQFGIGFDQLLVVESPDNPEHDFKYRIFNASGEEVEQCGNGARCFMRFVSEKGLTEKQHILVETAKGVISPCLTDDNLITVVMGQPRFSPVDIPFMSKQPALTYPITIDDETYEISCVNIGNPHATLLVDNVFSAPVTTLGAQIESSALFPQKVNVGFMEIVNESEISVRVFERGVGETLSCGTGACAAVVNGIRLGKLAPSVTVYTRGGELQISWQEGQSVVMTGPAVIVYEGEVRYG